MTRYIHGKDWDVKFLEALVLERMKPFIIKNCPLMQIGGMKGNSSSAHYICKNMDEKELNKQYSVYL